MTIRLEVSEKLDALADVSSLGSTTPEVLLVGLDAIRSLLLQSINEVRRAEKPPWVALAEKYIGLTEVAGAQHAEEILRFWKDIKRGGIKDDETPWCAAFVGAMLERAGIVSSRFESAKSYLTWGFPLAQPLYGCIVVFSRDNGGHVGFVVGQTTKGNLMVLGGNQGNMVSVLPFDVARVQGYRWPGDYNLVTTPMPLLVGGAALSTSEA